MVFGLADLVVVILLRLVVVSKYGVGVEPEEYACSQSVLCICCHMGKGGDGKGE